MYRKLDELVNAALQPDDSLDFNSKVDEAAVRRLTHKKLGLPAQVAAAPRRKSKALRRVLAFAAVAGALTVGAFAAAQLFPLGEAPVEHFGGAASASGAQNQYESLKPTMEQMTTAANLSQTVEDVTITLQTVTADSNSLNLAFVIDTPHLDLNQIGASLPDWYKAHFVTPYPGLKIGGKKLQWNELNFADSYVDEAGLLHTLYHIPAKEALPSQFLLEVEIREDENAVSGLPEGASFAFALEIDRGNASAADKVVAGQTIELGQEYPLQLNELRQSGLGTLLRFQYEVKETTDSIQETVPRYCVRDEAGNILGQISHNQTSRLTPNDTVFGVAELLTPSPESTSLSFVPLLYNETGTGENRTYSVTDLGARVETTPLGGYIFTDYQVKGGQIKFTFTPYGYNTGLLEAVMQEPETVHYKGLRSERINYENGTLELFIDYYEATEAELKALEAFTVYYQPGWSLDEANAVTLPFGPAQ